jgi:hypothetical protein
LLILVETSIIYPRFLYFVRLESFLFMPLKDIGDSRLICAQSIPYLAAVKAYGGAEAVVNILFATIRLEIKRL